MTVFKQDLAQAGSFGEELLDIQYPKAQMSSDQNPMKSLLLIRILIMVYYHPYIAGFSNPLYNPVCFDHC